MRAWPITRLKLSKTLLLGAILSALVACGANPVSDIPSGSYVLTVPLQANDTQQSITQRYGGELIAWVEGQRAVLRLSAQAKTTLSSRGVSLQGTTIESNIPLNAPEVQASGWSAWAGGWNAWAGGWNAWAGGWNTWAGGTTTPSLPTENNPIWNIIRLKQAHSASQNIGYGVKVAVIDTGLDLAHPIFAGRLAPATEWKDFVDGDAYPQDVSTNTTPNAYGHGTAVAGIILQVAPRATILPIRVLSPNGSGTLDAVVQSIYWAADKGAKVINLSLGSIDYSAALYDAVVYAQNKGAYLVASAGNYGTTEPTYPAAFTGWLPDMKLFGIGSTTTGMDISSFSNHSWKNYASAPGEELYSSYPGSKTVKTQGTSFAAPLFAGAVALLYGDTTAANRPYLEYFLNAGIIKGRINNLIPNVLSRGILDVESALYNLPGFAARNTSTTYFGTNRGFESGLTGWYTDGVVTAVSSGARSGTKAAQIVGTGTVTQIISGLTPNTNYLATVWISNAGSTTAPAFTINDFDSSNAKLGSRMAQLPLAYTAGSYKRHAMAFTTGPTNTSVTVQVWSGDGTVLVDDMLVTKMPY